MIKFSHFIILILTFSVLVSIGGGALAAEDLPVPTIAVNPDIYYPLDEVLYLEGRAKPASTLQIQFQKSGAKPVRVVVKSDKQGEWSFADRVPLEAGDWEIRVRVVDGEFSSEWSNPRVFKVISSGITIGGVNVKFAALSLIILALLVFGGAAVFFLYLRVRGLNAALVSKEVREARDSVREGFSELRKDMLEELRILNEAPGPHSPEMLQRKEHVLRELDMLERSMEKEIGDIEKRV